MDIEIVRRSLPAIISFAKDIFFDEEDESDDSETILEKVELYAEKTVPNMTDRQFKIHFRMYSATFEDLLIKVQAVANKKVTPGQPEVLIEKQVMITIWYLANPECFRSVADRFGISKSTCWNALYKTCKLLLKVNKKFKIICWPCSNRGETIARNFQLKHNLPGVIGAIDGSHIPIVAPKENHTSYINRKGYHSILLQGVYDDKMLFTDVYAGEAGSIHDWTLFRRSDLYTRILNNDVQFPNDSHLIGDLAYSLSTNLLVGFKDTGHLSRREKHFNLTLSKTRAIIENAYALLKGRFRRLKLLETVRLDLISLLIVSACILHNICIIQTDLLEDMLNLDQELGEERCNNPNNVGDIIEDRNTHNAAIAKRYNIVNSLPIL